MLEIITGNEMIVWLGEKKFASFTFHLFVGLQFLQASCYGSVPVLLGSDTIIIHLF